MISLCGKNGSGKSSLLKLICGGDICYTGDIIKSSRLVVSYVSQSTDSIKGTISEYSDANGIDESLLKSVLSKLDFSGVQLEKSMEHLSEGQKKKVLLAGSICKKAHLYIWDEPLNYIDVISRIQIEELLKKYKPTIIFVEHDRMFSENIASKRIDLQ